MADQIQAQQNPESTQESAMPTENQQTTQAQGTDAVPQGTISSETTDQGLPDQASERTRREFEKLQTQLREERNRRKYLESVQPPQQEQQITPLYDPNTGLLDENAFAQTQRLAIESDQRARQAEQRLQEFTENQERADLYGSFPELNPQAKEFDKTLDSLTAGIWYASQVTPERFGKQLSQKEAASEAKKILSGGNEKAKQQGAEEALTQLTPKEQATLSAAGSSNGRSQIANQNIDDLRLRTRKGGDEGIEAAVQRLKGIPWR